MKGKFDWRAAYFHIVSLVAMVTFLIAAITAGHGALKLLFPTLSMNQYDWERTESFEAYKRSRAEGGPKLRPGLDRPAEPEAATAEERTEEELRRDWQEARTMAVTGQKRSGLWSMIESLVTVVIVLPIFWWHRRAARRIRDTETGEGNIPD